ncbi:MAG: hypothetical protein Q4G33_01280 [bacterium]|nr:hypothetical protein [bacterium]
MFTKKKTKKIPDGFTAADIKTESSICTGETTIGFYNRKTGSLAYAELVRSSEDIKTFYLKYGVDVTEDMQ